VPLSEASLAGQCKNAFPPSDGAYRSSLCLGSLPRFCTWLWPRRHVPHFRLIAKQKKQRKLDTTNVYDFNEVKTWSERFHPKELAATMFRPYQMLIFEPIILFLSLSSGFADALIVSFIESYGIHLQTMELHVNANLSRAGRLRPFLRRRLLCLLPCCRPP
jgi:hypothetical protein